MRIALVCPYAWDRFGGVQSHVRSLAAVLRRREHEVLVIAPTAARPEPADGVAFAGRTVDIPANGSIAPLSFGPVATAAVRRALRDFEPEVLHLHEPLIPSLSLLALWNAPCPAVGTFHAAAEESSGYRVARAVLDRAANRLAIRTAVSGAAKALASMYFPGDYVITPNGIDFERFASAVPRVIGYPGRPKVLFLSRLERRKGIDVLLQAMSTLSDVGCELVVAGDGPQRGSAQVRAPQLGVDAHFLGRVDDDDVASLFKTATVYCAPGVGGESFGIVLVEAMSAGAPIVCSDLPGFREVAAGAAELVPPGDPDALAAALRRVLTDPAKQAEMREKSLHRAHFFDWARLVRDVEHLYEHATRA
ncbi:MAG: glycosyltransferase family 4 protein [Actinomycetota bacterium]